MEYFQSARIIRLRTSTNKYMSATDDRIGIKQSRNGQSPKSKWKVEISQSGKMIRLMSCYGKYLTATDESFLLGVTGRKIAQSTPATEAEVAIDWEPIRVGVEIKLRARSGSKFLRANRGPPPYKDTITVDNAASDKKSRKIMWTVDILETVTGGGVGGGVGGGGGGGGCGNNRLSCGSTAAASVRSGSGSDSISEMEMTATEEEDEEEEDGESVFDETASFSSLSFAHQRNGMELFHNAMTVRLRSHHDKYLLADSSDSVSQNRKQGGSRRARWTVEYVTSNEGVNKVRLKSCYDKYLTATDDHFGFGMTGKKVVQRKLARPDSSVEWEPIREGMQVRLKTRYGNYLRANGGVPPWRNSITHDVPSRNHTKHWILWDIDVLAVYEEEKKKKEEVGMGIGVKEHQVEVEEEEEEGEDDDEDEDLPFSADWIRTIPNKMESSSDSAASPSAAQGRVINYNVVDDDGNIVDEGNGGIELVFKGNTLDELKQKLMEETSVEDFIVCSRNPLNGKLYPLRLALPPNHVKMHVFVVPSSSKVAGEL